MKFLKVLKRKKLIFLNIFLMLYITFNILSGERGLISYFEKKSVLNDLNTELSFLKAKLQETENKNNLLSSNLNLDFVDILVREKFMFGNKDEILIKLND